MAIPRDAGGRGICIFIQFLGAAEAGVHGPHTEKQRPRGDRSEWTRAVLGGRGGFEWALIFITSDIPYLNSSPD